MDLIGQTTWHQIWIVSIGGENLLLLGHSLLIWCHVGHVRLLERRLIEIQIGCWRYLLLHLVRSKGDSTMAHLILLLYLLCAQDTLKALNLTSSSLNEGFVGVESRTTYQLLLALVLNDCWHFNCSIFWSGQRLSQSIWPIDILIILI